MRTIILTFAMILLSAPSGVAGEQASGGLHATIQDYLDRTDDAIDNVELWKFKLDVHLGQRMIYDDNIFLNNGGEPNTEGRKTSAIWQTNLGVGLVLPFNADYVKWFDTDELTILRYELQIQEYLSRGDLDNLGHHFKTDLFSFLSDLFNVTGEAANIYFRVRDDFEFNTDPLDLELKNLRLIGLPTVKAVTELERWENRLDVTLGYEGNLIFAAIGYRNEYYSFSDDLFEQADHTEHTYRARVGVNLPNMEDKRVYVEGRYRVLDFHENILNDSFAAEGAVGFEGLLFSRKIRINAEVGAIWWNSTNRGKTADDDEFTGGIGLLRAIFRPWKERKLSFQVELSRSVGWSAIANFRKDDQAVLSVVYEVLPKKLEVDITISVSDHNESDGPDRTLTEGSIGVVYHLFKQADVTARYQYRLQNSWNELSIFAGPGSVFSSDGDFNQNVFMLGLDLNF